MIKMVYDIRKLLISSLLYCSISTLPALAGCNGMHGRNRMQNPLADRIAADAGALVVAGAHANVVLSADATNAIRAADNAANVATGVFDINTVDQYRNAATDANNSASAAGAACDHLAQDDQAAADLVDDLIVAYGNTNAAIVGIVNHPDIDPALVAVVNPLVAQLHLPDDLRQQALRLRAGAEDAQTAAEAYNYAAGRYHRIDLHFRHGANRIEEVSHR